MTSSFYKVGKIHLPLNYFLFYFFYGEQLKIVRSYKRLIDANLKNFLVLNEFSSLIASMEGFLGDNNLVKWHKTLKKDP